MDGPAAQRQRLAILAFLAASGGHATRDQVVAVLWREGDPGRARHALSNALYGLRNALPDDPVEATGERLYLDAGVISSDLADFEEAIRLQEWDRAVAVYAGPFLDGVGAGHVEFEQWVESVRDRLARSYLGALERLGADAVARGDTSEAVECWRAFVNTDPWSTPGTLALMRALEADGNPTAAVRHARVHAALLREELETEPDPSVVGLEEEIRARMAREREAEPSGGQPEAAGPGAGTPGRERQLHALLGGTGEPKLRSRLRALISSRNGVVGIAALAIFVAVASAVVRGGAEGGANSAQPSAYRSVAVLPLDNLSPDPADEYFAGAMTEVLTAELSRLDSLTVVSRTSASRFRSSGLSVPEIARQLSVEAVIEGSVFRSGDRLRITVQLIDGASDTHVWAGSYEAPADDPIALQRQVAGEIAAAVSLELSPREAERLARGPTASGSAQESFLRGLAESRRFTRASVSAALGHYEEALRIAPDFADAAGMLGVSYWLLSQPLAGLAPNEGMPLARRWAEHAVELDPGSADGLATLGWVSLFYDRNLEQAARYFEQAIEVRPAWGVGHNGLSFTHLVAGRVEEAIEAGRRAAGGIPLDLSFRTALAEVFYYARRYDEALAELGAVEVADPGFVRLYDVRRHVYEAQELWSEALDAYRAFLRLTSDDLDSSPPMPTQPTRANYWAWRIEVLEHVSREGAPLTVWLGAAYLRAGDTETALTLLQRAVNERSGQLVLLGVDPAWDPLRTDSRFTSLLERLGIPIIN